MTTTTFTLRFFDGEGREVEIPPATSEVLDQSEVAELDEIAELRRLVLEITNPEPASYTAT